MQKYSLPYIKVHRDILHFIKSTSESVDELFDILHSEYAQEALLASCLSCFDEPFYQELTYHI